MDFNLQSQDATVSTVDLLTFALKPDIMVALDLVVERPLLTKPWRLLRFHLINHRLVH